MDIYRQLIIDHYRNPRNRGALDEFNISFQGENPSCGDSVSVQGLVESDRMIALSIKVEGCVISQAAGSMLSERCVGRSIEDVKKIDKDLIMGLLGIKLGPVRIKCALLSLESLHKSLLALF